jgi:hypothetical protein
MTKEPTNRKKEEFLQDSLNENFGLELFKLIYQADRHGVPVETICAALDKFNETEVGALHRVEAT